MVTAALLTIGALIPLAFGIAGACNVDYGNRGGL